MHGLSTMGDDEIRFGRFRLDPVRRVLLDGGAPARIGSRAVDLLAVLAAQRGRVVGKRELFDRVWPDLVVEENNLQQQISALRKLLGPQAIATVPGRGYQFTLAVDEAPVQAPVAPTAEPAPAPPGNLPAQGPALIGRETGLDELIARLPRQPLLTLVGPGGIGKTRLALAAAHACADRFGDGVWVVDLSAVADGAQLAPTVAHELGIRLPADADADGVAAAATGAGLHRTIAAALRRQHLLLVLDNCEHVRADAAALAVALRHRAPGVHLLATSQEPLGVADEHLLRLAPLALPPLAPAAIDAGAAAAYGAVQLFITRARAVERGFVPGPTEIAAVVEICRRLDGLPLAIELAAARVPLLGVHELARRLDERLRLLAARQPRWPPRQQTLRATLDWSHALLGADEQRVFRRLAVFAGGFAIDGAGRVLADAGRDPWEMLDHLGALVDKSLVMVDAGDPPRYRLLESARAYALEQLEAAGETAALRERHARALSEQLRALDQAVAQELHFEPLLRRMALEMDNLRAAMAWTIEAGGGAGAQAAAARRIGIELAAFSDWLWAEVDPYGDGYAYCRTVRGWLDDTVPTALAARLRLAFQAHARTRRLPPSVWLADVRAALEQFRASGDRVGLYRALCVLGRAPRSVVGGDEAAALLHEAASLEDPRWSPRLRMRLQSALEWMHDLAGRLELSREAGLRHLALARQTGGAHEIAALGNLADTTFALGHVDEAIALCREAIERANAQSRPSAASNAYDHLVPALLERGRLEEAEAALRAGRALHLRSLGTAYEMLVPLSLLVLRRGEPRLAARLIGCADRDYADHGQQPDPPEQRMRATVLTELSSALPAAELSALIEEGAGWGEDEGYERAGLG